MSKKTKQIKRVIEDFQTLVEHHAEIMGLSPVAHLMIDQLILMHMSMADSPAEAFEHLIIDMQSAARLMGYNLVINSESPTVH